MEKSNLNERQAEAVRHTDGPLLIVAGAGAGKTKTITARIAELIKSGVAPSAILAVTFTNKAAKEMRDRVNVILSQDKNLNLPVSFNDRPLVATFHSLGVQILKENARQVGIVRHFNIFDKSDSRRAVKDAITTAGFDPKQFEPGRIQNIISREKGNLKNCEKYTADAGNEYLPQVVSKIWREYEKILANEKALDFDDLLLKTVELLQKFPKILENYQQRWLYIHIDEYQDTNRVQYMLAKLLAAAHKNICVVGDLDQCLLPGTKVRTDKGNVPIEKIFTGEKVVSASGRGLTCTSTVSKSIKRKFTGDIVTITTKSGKKIQSTPSHVLFAKLPNIENNYYVYLMYRRDKGFRIGLAKTMRKNGTGDDACGLQVRCNQEKADKMWVLKICETRKSATYWENFYAAEYGIPTVVFHPIARKIILDQKDINTLFKNIDTTERAQKLFEATGLSFDYPHYLPQGTTKTNTERERINVNLYMFGDKRKSTVHPWGLSRVSINTTSLDLKQKLESAGFSTRAGKSYDWRLEIFRLDYGEAEKTALKILGLKPFLTMTRRAFITENKSMSFHPASNIIPGMQIGVFDKGKIYEDTVISVEKKPYRGYVYDLDIAAVHNYIANDVIVHNSIYTWRGATIKNLMDFEKDYPDAKIVLLEENYRSTKRILEVANTVIKKNKQRIEKNLFTANPQGEKLGIYPAYDEADEASFVAAKAKSLIDAGTAPREIAVLYRANFQSRVLEEAFLSENIPYQVLGVRFFERKEVKDVLSYIKAAMNPESFSDLKRVINTPPQGIGKTTFLKIISGQENSLPPTMRQKISNFRARLARIKEHALKEKPSVTIKFVLSETGLGKLYKTGDEEDTERLENLKELASLALRYDALPPEEGMEKLLADAALASDQDDLKEDKNAVRLMTVHSAKGLEFEIVFITGLEENLFPHQKLGEREQTEDEAEEERRLFYVALTRAKKKIFLTYASVRTIFGSRQMNLPSEFFADIDNIHLDEEFNPKGVGKIIYLD